MPPAQVASDSKLLETHAKAALKDAQPGILTTPSSGRQMAKSSSKLRLPAEQIHAASVNGKVPDYTLVDGSQPRRAFE